MQMKNTIPMTAKKKAAHFLPGHSFGRRFLAVFLCLANLLLLTGCGSSNHGLNPKKPVIITVWHYYNGSQAIAFDDLVSQFNSTVGSEKGIIVEAVSKSSVDDLNNAIIASAEKKPGAEDLPNMFQCYLDTAVNLDQLDILAGLDSYVSDEERAAYVDSYLAEGILGEADELKLFPIAKSTELLAVNETAFRPFAEAAGITEEDLATWEGLVRTAEAYYEYSGGKSFFGRDSFANYMIIGSMQLGEEIFQVEKGNVTVNLNEAAMRRLWDNYYIPYVKGYYHHTGRFRTDDIKTGSIIAAVGSNTGMTYLPSELTDEAGNTQAVTYQMLPVPNFEGTESYAVQQGASMAVTKSSETEEYASVTFLKWLTEEQNNIRLSISSCYLPVRKAANDMGQIDTYLQQNSISLSELEHQTLETAIYQVKNSTLYTSKGFKEGYDARNLLNTSMIDLAIQDCEAIQSAVASGTSREDALAPYLTDEYFQQWYQDLKSKMDKICGE